MDPNGPCLQDTTLVALVERRLEPSEREVAVAHLETCLECQGVLALMKSGDSADGPQMIDRFAVIRTLGQGAMGIVYLAYDAKLERRVAIKVLDASDEGVEARIVKEARALARLNHPNVVTVYDVGVHESHVYMAMEFVNGRTLREWCSEKPSQREILEAFLQAGEGLLVAHRAGVVHRDFKPENVLVGRDGRVRVLDFGLARSAQQKDSFTMPVARVGGTTLSRTGGIVGTPAYMAPEQCLGQPVDARTDQFAFAVSVAEALYGDRPFKGRSFDELRDAVLSSTPTLPDADTAINRVLRRALSRDREGRYPSMAELLTELRAALEPTVGTTPDLSTAPQRSRRWLWAPMVVSLAALGVFTTMRRPSDVPMGTAATGIVSGAMLQPSTPTPLPSLTEKGSVTMPEASAPVPSTTASAASSVKVGLRVPPPQPSKPAVGANGAIIIK